MRDRKTQRALKRAAYKVLDDAKYSDVRSDPTARNALKNSVNGVKFNANQARRPVL